MADSELADLTEDTSPSSSDIGYTVKDPAGTPLDRKATWLNIVKGALLGVLTSNNDMLVRASGVATRLNIAANKFPARSSAGDIAAKDITDFALTILDDANAAATLATLGISTYTAYVPTITQSATITTSSMEARYHQTGKHVHAWGRATASSAGTANNPIVVALPVTASSSYNFAAAIDNTVGTGIVADVGTIWMPAVACLVSTSAISFTKTNGDAESRIGNTPNFAIASGDRISWNITYEAA